MGDRTVPRQVLTPGAFLFDLDGTLYTAEGPVPGAAETVAELRRRGIPMRFITNTTMRSRDALLELLASYGMEVGPLELYTPAAVAEVLIAKRGFELVAPFVTDSLRTAMARTVRFAGGTAGPVDRVPDAILLGDLGAAWTHALLTEAFRHVMDGAACIALQKGRYWLGETGLELDAGAYVAAVEYATGREAVVCGKPSRPFFDTVLESLPGDAGPVVMVGDDLVNDVRGAQQAGIEGWLVRTGKFRADVLARSEIVPDRVIGSVTDVVG